MLAKQQIYQAMEELPERISADEFLDAMERLVLVEKAKEGLEDVRAGRVLTTEQVLAKLFP